MREQLKRIIEEENIIKQGKTFSFIVEKNISKELKKQIYLSTVKCRDNISERIYWIMNDIYDYPICIECGTQWQPRYYGLNCKSFNERRFCSKKCLATNKEVQDKREKTLIFNHGIENVFQMPSVKQKIKKTNLERRGVEYITQCKNICKKIADTCEERYGVSNPAQSAIVQEKIQNTCEERYGVKNAMQNKDIVKKAGDTCEKIYGVRNAAKTKLVQEKIADTCEKLYGVRNIMYLPEIKQKIKITCIEKYGVEHPLQNQEILEKNQKKRFKYLTLPSGREIYYQGYENVAINKLLENFYEEEIVTSRKEMPEVWYEFEHKNKRYFPDIWIPKENLIIEVKSTYTYKKDLEKNIKKKEATLELGYNFQFWICSNSKILSIF